MRKKYVKPKAIFESFELSASIAAGCMQHVGFGQGSCALQIGGRFVFLEGNNACTTISPGDEYAGFCYHQPSEASKLFSS